MPYIKKEQRAFLDRDIHELAESIRRTQPDLNVRKGLVNYAITRVVLQAMKPDGDWNYHSISNAISALRDAADEISRRVMDFYEGYKSQENSDVIEFEQAEEQAEAAFQDFIERDES